MTCRLPGCDNECRTDGQDSYANAFCSTGCELKYDHLKDDARAAKYDAQDNSEPYL